MSRTPRGLVAASVVLAVAASLLAGLPAADATRVPAPRADRSVPKFTPTHARAVLAKAERQLKPDARRIKAHEPVGNGPSTDITLTMRDLFFARPSLTGDDRAQADAILARPSDPTGDDLGGGLSVRWTAPTANRHNNCQGSPAALALHVCVHWVTGTSDNAYSSYVAQVSQVMEHVWDTETGTTGMGYRTPLPDTSAGTVDNPDTRTDVYLADLTSKGLYGYCVPTDDTLRHVPAYCVLDNNFLGYGTTSTKALDVTAAHEFFHAIQFGYDAGEDTWFMEGTATWMEDEVYDAINDNLQFLVQSPIRFPYAPADLTTDFHRYGAWIFFKYASERLGRDIVLRMWQLADSSTSKYYSLQAIRAAVTARTPWTPFFATFAAWNTRQPHGYSEASLYPTPQWIRTSLLSKKHVSTGWVSINLPHLSSAPVKVVPTAKLKPGKHLRIDANLPPTGRGSALLVQRRYKNGTVANSMMRLNSQGDGHVTIGFNRKYVAYVALIPTNTSTAMVYCDYIAGPDGYPAYSCAGRGYYDYKQKYMVRAKVA